MVSLVLCVLNLAFQNLHLYKDIEKSIFSTLKGQIHLIDLDFIYTLD